jgi:Zn-dependent metalloprotease
MDKTAHIYYEHRQRLAVSGADYEDVYYGLQQSCRNLIGNYGITADDCEQVRLAGVTCPR